eukprot:TRINITY_DN821_c0_g1_i4.p3 TRINITY_DN821_c0_g1~~TRINITY_DN821_c0_g1_i4.p3  ORF type:complete len:107 (-),score=20.96 TRINITY_DN821_c0_g1_i4:379-699(-)
MDVFPLVRFNPQIDLAPPKARSLQEAKKQIQYAKKKTIKERRRKKKKTPRLYLLLWTIRSPSHYEPIPHIHTTNKNSTMHIVTTPTHSNMNGSVCQNVWILNDDIQ